MIIHDIPARVPPNRRSLDTRPGAEKNPGVSKRETRGKGNPPTGGAGGGNETERGEERSCPHERPPPRRFAAAACRNRIQHMNPLHAEHDRT